MTNSTPHTVFELVTPDRARDWLHMNKNRPQSESYVKELAEKMKNGTFMTTHQGIAFDWEGFLRDGQHRLRGIVLSGEPQTLSITYGLDPACYDVMDDRVRSRSMADRLSVSPSEVAILNVLYRAGSGLSPSDKTPSTKAHLDPYMPKFGKGAHELLAFCKTSKRLLSCAPIRAAAVLCSLDRSKEYAFNGYRKLISGDANNMDPVQRALFSWVTSNNSVHGDQWRAPILTRSVMAFDPRWSRLEGLNFRLLDKRMDEISTRIKNVIGGNQNG